MAIGAFFYACSVILTCFFGFAVSLDHFKLLRVVGKGAFGKVRIVERKDTGLTFALKYIRKDEGELPLDLLRASPSIV